MGENLPAKLSAFNISLVTVENSRAVGKLWPGQLTRDEADKQGARCLRLAFLQISNPKAEELQKCALNDPDSVLHSVKESAELGLEIGGSRQQGALVPYAGKCQYQPMYRGLIELAMRPGTIVNVEAGIIYEGDLIEYSRGFPPKFAHVPWLFRKDDAKPSARGDKAMASYALFWFKDAPIVNGCSMPKIEVVEKWEIDRISSRAKNQSSSGPWKMWWEEMAKKTAIKRACKTLRLSTELARAIEMDNEIEGAIDTDFTVVEDKKPGALTAGRHALPKKPARGAAEPKDGSDGGTPEGSAPPEEPDRVSLVDTIQAALDDDATHDRMDKAVNEECKAAGIQSKGWGALPVEKLKLLAVLCGG